METKSNNKLNILDTGALDLAKMLSGENIYKTTAIFSYIVLFITAFLISMGDAKFIWSRLFEAKFWIDFSITFGGGMFLKWVFGKWGMAIGNRHPDVINIQKSVENTNKTILRKNLKFKLKEYIKNINYKRKLNAIRAKVFHKLNKPIKFKKHWLTQKEAILLAEDMFLGKLTPEASDKAEKKLQEINFDVDTYRIKYAQIKESALQTGFSTSNNNEQTMSFSEWYEMFGKSSMISLISFLATILLAVSSFLWNELSLVTLMIFFTRILMFTVNSVFGFINGKRAIEYVKYNILLLVDSFLNLFIETYSPEEVNANVTN